MEVSAHASASINSARHTWTLSDTLEHKVLRITSCGLKIVAGIKTSPKVVHKFEGAVSRRLYFLVFSLLIQTRLMCERWLPAGRIWGTRSLPTYCLTGLAHRGVLYAPELISIHKNTKEEPVANMSSCFCALRRCFCF